MKNGIKHCLAIVALVISYGPLMLIKGQTELTTLVKQVRPSVVTVIAFNADGRAKSQGTAFFISTNGMLVTNYHVIRGAHHTSIKTRNGDQYRIVETVAIEPESDLALIRADVEGALVRPLRLSTALAVAGQRIVVVGSPLGLEETVSEGIVSAVRKVEGFGEIIQITAPISPGSSGSPVINLQGDIVGVATLNLKGGQNLNFAIPSQTIASLVRTGNSSAINQTTRAARRTTAVTNKRKTSEELAFDKMFAEMMEDERKSIPILERHLTTHPKDVEAYENLGRAYSNNRQLQKAIDLYEKALAYGAESAVIQVSLCDAYSDTDQFAIALGHCDRALQLKPGYSHALTAKGRSLTGLGRIDEALQVLKEAIKENPQETYAHEQLGFIYMDLGRYEDAVKAFEFMASIASRYPPSFVNLAWAYEMLDRDDDAEESYRKAIEIDKYFNEAYLRLAKLYERENRTTDALNEYKTLIALDPKNGDAYLNMGLLYLSIGDRRSTLDTFEKLKKIDPTKARLLSGAIYK